MTDLSKVLEAVRASKVDLDADFWEKQNQQIADNQKRFAETSRNLQVNQTLLQTPFSI